MGAPSGLLASSSRQSLRTQSLAPGRGRAAAPRRQVAVSTKAVSSDANKLLKKPELKRPEAPPKRLFEEGTQQPAADPVAAAAAAPAAHAQPSAAGGVTIEWQRQRAKEMRKYFQDLQLEKQVQKGSLFGWTPANEIGNGRWVMFGVFVGLLTEYATGVDFPDQIALMLSYLGIVDAE